METRRSYRKTRYLGLSLIALGVLMFLAGRQI